MMQEIGNLGQLLHKKKYKPLMKKHLYNLIFLVPSFDLQTPAAFGQVLL